MYRIGKCAAEPITNVQAGTVALTQPLPVPLSQLHNSLLMNVVMDVWNATKLREAIANTQIYEKK